MDLMLIERNKRDNSTDLVCISEENQIYVPQIIVNSPAYLKKGSVVWVKRQAYDVYELTEDITDENQNELIKRLQRAEDFITNIFL